MAQLEMWTDGSCHNLGAATPQLMGFGITVKLEQRHILSFAVAAGLGTNNQAELGAVLTVLCSFLPEHRKKHKFTLFSDSLYAIGQATSRYKVNTNKKLVEEVRAIVATYPMLTFQHVTGHSVSADNNLVDKIANIGRTYEGKRPANVIIHKAVDENLLIDLGLDPNYGLVEYESRRNLPANPQ